MKILCISDHEDRLIYSHVVKIRFGDVDLVLSSGDLNMEYYGYIVSSLNIPLLFVFGNHNLKRIGDYKRSYENHNIYEFKIKPKQSFGSTYVGGKSKKVKGLIIAGLGGCMKYNDGINQYTEFEMFINILKLIPKLFLNKILFGKYLDILLTHAPPFGIHDEKDRCHRGFKVFLWFMRMFKPKYLIHGHIHLYDLNRKRVTKYNNTYVINSYEHFLLDTEKELL